MKLLFFCRNMTFIIYHESFKILRMRLKGFGSFEKCAFQN